MLKAISLTVVGAQQMACEGCENRVMRLLKAVPGVARVRARAADQHIEIQFDPTVVDEALLADRLRVAGYDTTTAAHSAPSHSHAP